MIITIELNKRQTEIMRMLYGMLRDPEIASIDDYASVLFTDLIQRIWNDVRNDILN